MRMHVAFRDVRVGDKIYNGSGYVPHWITVKNIERSENGSVGLATSEYTQWGHEREGITIIREGDHA